MKVLLIEDDEADVFLVQEILRGGRPSDLPPFEIIPAYSLAEGLRALEEKSPDIVLLDLMLPDSRGIDSLRSVVARAGEIPVVVLSGINDESLSIEAARYGAQDFLVKGHVETMWLSRIMHYALVRKMARVAEGKNLVATVSRALDAVTLESDASGTIVKANRAAEQLFGADVVGRSEAELEERLTSLAQKILKKRRTENALERT